MAFGVFGPSPGEEVEQAGAELRKVEQGLRSAASGGSTGNGSGGQGQSGEWIFGDLAAEEVGNVAMFVPLGALFPLLWPRRRWLTVPAGVALSGFIELVQLVFLSWRSPSLADVGWNSLGVVIGFVLWLAVSWCRRHVVRGSAPPLTDAAETQ